MKNVIYQYWDGNVRPSAQYGSDCMRAYAERIGADYVFERNANFGKKFGLGRVAPYYGCFKPVFDDKYLEYDNVLFCDTDIFPVEGLTENIFESFSGELAMAQEPLQPLYRYDPKLKKQCNEMTETRWMTLVRDKYGCKLPMTIKGVCLYTIRVLCYTLIRGCANVESSSSRLKNMWTWLIVIRCAVAKFTVLIKAIYTRWHSQWILIFLS